MLGCEPAFVVVAAVVLLIRGNKYARNLDASPSSTGSTLILWSTAGLEMLHEVILVDGYDPPVPHPSSSIETLKQMIP